MAAVWERSLLEIGEWEREREEWREIRAELGVNAIPGVKYSDSAGGFFYEDSGRLQSVTRSRFIHWTTSGDTLQLTEQSLDCNLLNNTVRIKFLNCHVLPGGVHVHETHDRVTLLILTNQTVHRIVLPHPSRMYRSELITDGHIQSIFTDIGKLNLRDPANSFLIPGVQGHSTNSTASATWLNSDGDALFALASLSGGILIIQLPEQDTAGNPVLLELKHSSVMQRLLTGWMPTAIRGDQGPSDLPVSLAVQLLEHDAFIFALCQDHKLRLWSFKDQLCLMVADLLVFVPVNKELRHTASLGHKLRLAYSSSGFFLAVYLHCPKRGQFCVFQLVSCIESNRYSLDHISTLFFTQETLVDFALTPTDIWALWQDEDNQANVRYISFEHNNAGQWNPVFTQPVADEELHIPEDQDPKEAYLEYLFAPGRFTAQALLKALQIYCRGADRIVDPTVDGLKKEVTLAVENAIKSSVTEYEFSQEVYRQLQVEFWSKFYACCLQYQEALARPLALLVNARTNMVCLLKKGFLSFFFPCFAIDHLYMSSDECLFLEDECSLTDDPDVARDLHRLVQCLRLVGDAITLEMASLMETAVSHLHPPEKAAEQILEFLLARDTETHMELQSKLQDIGNPGNIIQLLLREMDQEGDLDTGDVQPLHVRMNMAQFFGSNVAINIVCRAVSHISTTRFLICRDLLILEQLMLHLGDSMNLGAGGYLLQLQQDLIPRTSLLVCSYFVVRWASRSLATAVPIDMLESNLRQLSVLELTDSRDVTSQRPVTGPGTVVELFYRTVARKHILSRLLAQANSPLNQPLINYPQVGIALASHLLQYLWANNSSFLFAEFLMGHCQYVQLQEYVRLLQPWCEVNVGSRRFVLGQCYLVTGEGHKALECFCDAAAAVDREEFLDRLIQVEDEEAASNPRVQYYNKVLRLLEDMALPALVLQLAAIAVTEARDDWKILAALWTKIFKHHLDLGHNHQAYESLTQNPDSSRQLDCLRQLVVVLCERSQLQDLVEFPYINLHDEVVAIIESRARAVDLLTHNYYELLYAFHVQRHNFRKAGTVMFEYGMRLGREVRSLDGLQKQVNCYLVGINCLRQIRSEYAWIVRPVCGATYERPGASPKRSYDGEPTATPVCHQVDIVELKDLEKEFVLARTRLLLAKHDPCSAAIAGSASAEEMVALLVQVGLFDAAVSLCQTFRLSLNPIFEGLSFKCIKLQLIGEAAHSDAWDWLKANQIPSIIATKESSATDEAWRLLSSYLDRYQSPSAQYHRCVINKLLSHGVPLPNWLINSYKKVDVAGLLRLYLNYDLLEEAVELVLEYVDALMGKGPQYFNMERSLSATAPAVWLPYTAIDQLLQALGENPGNLNNVRLCEKLRSRLADYHQQVDQTTLDMNSYRRQQQQLL
ncbi:nuclear pore complex protein Nup160 [Hemiscyllium ocellatum]|uniref:nuclear pore complex protein Nup160 n=1 Tax=Hemiscyllium ocellatum TaxID=170820 RepID=UPI002965F045|nr:nuclear pore complex protein Nup160 [Hemiscyllium ocellatum]